MIEGMHIIDSGIELEGLGILLGIIMILAFIVIATEAVSELVGRRADKALAFALAGAVIIVLFNPVIDKFTYKWYKVEVSRYVTVSEITEMYEISNQNDDGTLVLKEKQINGKS